LLDPGSRVAADPSRLLEEDVTSVEQGSDVTIAEPRDNSAELGHGDSLGSADVDAPEERYPRRISHRFLTADLPRCPAV
jgi:hypothetical protein